MDWFKILRIQVMVSKVLRTLEKAGLITRLEHKTDTRAKTVHLTDKGIVTLKKSLAAVEKMDEKFFSVLGGKLGTFNSNMNKLIQENKIE